MPIQAPQLLSAVKTEVLEHEQSHTAALELDDWDGYWKTNRRTGEETKIQWTTGCELDRGGVVVVCNLEFWELCFWNFPFNILGIPMTTGNWTMGDFCTTEENVGMHLKSYLKAAVRIQ